MEEVGRPTELTDELTFKIRTLVLEGKEYVKIQEELGIVTETWDGWVWRDYKGFRDMLIKAKKERMIRESERVMGSLVYADDLNIQYKSASFLLETLAKDEGYSKRSEVTGKDGKEIQGNTIIFKNFKDETAGE